MPMILCIERQANSLAHIILNVFMQFEFYRALDLLSSYNIHGPPNTKSVGSHMAEEMIRPDTLMVSINVQFHRGLEMLQKRLKLHHAGIRLSNFWANWWITCAILISEELVLY